MGLLLQRQIRSLQRKGFVHARFGPPEGILSRCCRTYRLAYARCHVGKNSPPDCFLPQADACSLLVRIPDVSYETKKEVATLKGHNFFFGPPEGIRTPALQNRNLLRYPAAPQAEIYRSNSE